MPQLHRILAAHGRSAAILLICLFAGGVGAASAQEAAFSSRLLAPDPVWQALEGARAATGDEASSFLGNPAALALLRSPRCAFSHLGWAGGVSREWASLALPSSGGFSAGMDGAVLRTPVLQGYAAGGEETGSFQPSEWNAGLTLAGPREGPWQAGVGARLFRLENLGSPLTGVGLSAGLLGSWQSFRAGLAWTDAGRPARAGAARYPLPSCLRAGVERALAGQTLLVAASFRQERDRGASLAFGLCARPSAWLDLLGGISLPQGPGVLDGPDWSCGFRARQGGLAVSYAFRPWAGLESTHQFGLEFSFGAGRNSGRSIRG